MLLTNKDMRVSNSPLSVMNPQFNYCFLNDGLTHNRMECQLRSLLQWWTLRTAWCVSRQRRAFVININFCSILFMQYFRQEKILNSLDQVYINAGMTTNNIEPVLSPRRFYFPDKLLKNWQHDQRYNHMPIILNLLTSLQMKFITSANRSSMKF